MRGEKKKTGHYEAAKQLKSRASKAVASDPGTTPGGLK